MQVNKKTLGADIEQALKCRAGFVGKHCTLHSLAARSHPEAGGGGGGEVAGGDGHQWDEQLVELLLSGDL